MTKDIINNIEVDECVKYDKEQYLSCNMYYCQCVEIPNCYFKQLARAKEENEKLKSQITSQDCEIYDLKSQLQAKEHELIMMKADLCRGCQYRNDYKNIQTTFQTKEQEIEQVKKFVAGLMFDVDCANWFERFVFTFEDWKTELGNDRDKYKQALDEIEQLVTHSFCLTIGTNKDTANLAKQIMCLVAKAKEQ